jgi:hypothetical protein
VAQDSDPVPLDGKAPMTEQELLLWRKIMREYSHWSWIRRKVFPVTVTIAGGAWAVVQGIDWLVKHIKVTP